MACAGIETLSDYRFKFGRSALLEGGLAVNPSGCARSEARARCTWRRATRSLLPAAPPPPPALDHPACPYSKQFVHTKSSQYKKMKSEWRNNVYLARSHSSTSIYPCLFYVPFKVILEDDTTSVRWFLELPTAQATNSVRQSRARMDFFHIFVTAFSAYN